MIKQAKDIKPGDIVIEEGVKGILTVESVLELESNPPKYRIKFFGITEACNYKEDTKFTIIGQKEEDESN